MKNFGGMFQILKPLITIDIFLYDYKPSFTIIQKKNALIKLMSFIVSQFLQHNYLNRLFLLHSLISRKEIKNYLCLSVNIIVVSTQLCTNALDFYCRLKGNSCLQFTAHFCISLHLVAPFKHYNILLISNNDRSFN